MGLKINWKYAIIGLVILVAGFFAGRWTTPPKITIKTVKGKTIKQTFYSKELVPYKVEVPADPDLPMIHDTISGESIIIKVDTAMIIAEFIKKNSYEKVFFDNDTIGKLSVSAVIQYNKMQALGYDFTPVYKQITIQKKSVLTPFVTASYNSFNWVGAGAGVYYYDVGVQVKYITDFKNKGYEIGMNYKF